MDPIEKPWNERKAKRLAYLALTTVAALSVMFVSALVTNFKLDYNFDKFFPEGDRATKVFHDHRIKFGTDNDFVLIALVNHDGVFQQDFLLKVDSLAEDLGRIPHVDTVLSPTRLVRFEKEPVGTNFYPVPVLDINKPGTYKRDSAIIFNDERYANTFFSTTEPAVSLLLEHKDSLPKELCDSMALLIPQAIDKYGFDETHYAGRSVGQSYYIALMQHDLMVFISASIGLLIFFLIIAFRSVWGVIVPLTVVLLSNVWVLGFMALIDEPVNLILTVLPTIIFVVGMSDVVHIVSKYVEELRKGKAKLLALRIAFREIGIATLLTSITTAIGFLTLLTSPVGPIKVFGIYSAIGVMFAYILAFTLLPSILVLMGTPGIGKSKKDVWKKLLRTGFLWVIRHPRSTLAGSAVLIGLCIFSATRLEQNNYLLEDLRSRNEMKQHFLFFEKAFAGVRPFEMNIQVTDTSKNLSDYEVLAEINKLEDFLRANYQVGSLVSLNTAVKSIHQADWGGMPEKYSFPDQESFRKARIDKVLKNQMKRIKKTIKARSEGEKVSKEDSLLVVNTLKSVDTTLTMMRIMGRMPDLGSKRVGELNQDLERYYKDNINAGLIAYDLTGTAHLIDLNNSRLAGNMMIGLIIAFVLVGMIMGLLFRSFKMVVISLLPNVVPLLVIAGLLGASGTDLKVSVSIVFTIAFGIAVDDTIHFMSKIKLERLKGRSMIYALKRAYLSTGRAIIITTLILCSGFLLLVFSDFLGTFYIGYLISVTLFVAVIADLFLLPALLLVLHSREEILQTKD